MSFYATKPRNCSHSRCSLWLRKYNRHWTHMLVKIYSHHPRKISLLTMHYLEDLLQQQQKCKLVSGYRA